MAIRDLREMGTNLQKIFNRLLKNNDLLKLLYYTDKDPLGQNNLTEDQIKEEVFNKLIKVVPKVGAKETAKSVIAIRVIRGEKIRDNTEFSNLSLSIEVFTPLDQWIMKSDSLRPFLIMGEIKESLDDKRINGMGKLVCKGFDLSFLTEEVSCYEMSFNIVTYD